MDKTATNELELYEKLLDRQKEDVDVELKKLIALMRQVVKTETQIEELKNSQKVLSATKGYEVI